MAIGDEPDVSATWTWAALNAPVKWPRFLVDRSKSSVAGVLTALLYNDCDTSTVVDEVLIGLVISGVGDSLAKVFSAPLVSDADSFASVLVVLLTYGVGSSSVVSLLIGDCTLNGSAKRT